MHPDYKPMGQAAGKSVLPSFALADIPSFPDPTASDRCAGFLIKQVCGQLLPIEKIKHQMEPTAYESEQATNPVGNSRLQAH